MVANENHWGHMKITDVMEGSDIISIPVLVVYKERNIHGKVIWPFPFECFEEKELVFYNFWWWNQNTHVDGLVQERRNSIANALELPLSCTNLKMYSRRTRSISLMLIPWPLSSPALQQQWYWPCSMNGSICTRNDENHRCHRKKTSFHFHYMLCA